MAWPRIWLELIGTRALSLPRGKSELKFTSDLGLRPRMPGNVGERISSGLKTHLGPVYEDNGI